MLNKEKKDDGLFVSGNAANPDVTGCLPFVRFNPDNKYKFYQDFRWWEGIPDNVNFYPESEKKDSIVFVGDRHGIMDKHKQKGISGEYGNGSIFVYKEYIPHLLEWCRANFL